MNNDPTKEFKNIWEQILFCDHFNIDPNYYVTLYCPTSGCVGNEVHCLDCDAYISTCSCGFLNSINLVPAKREQMKY